MRDLVLTSEILTLPDMTGYLVIPGDYPVARVKYGFQPVSKLAEGFVEREGLSVSFPVGPPSGGAGIPLAGTVAALFGSSTASVAAGDEVSHAKVGNTGLVARAKGGLTEALSAGRGRA